MKSTLLLTMLLSALVAPITGIAFPCQTDYGTIEIPELSGFSKANKGLVQGIQQQKDAISSGGRLLFALTPINSSHDGETCVSMSHYMLITEEVGNADFDEAFRLFKENMAPNIGKTINGITFSGVKRCNGYFYTTGYFNLRTYSGASTASHQLGGIIMIKNHFFSFVAHTALKGKYTPQEFESRITNWLNQVVMENQNDRRGRRVVQNATVARFLRNGFSSVQSKGYGNRTMGIAFELEYPETMRSAPLGSGHAVFQFEEPVDGLKFTIEVRVFPLNGAIKKEFANLGNATAAERRQMAKKLADASVSGHGADILAYGTRWLNDCISFWYVSHQSITKGNIRLNIAMKTYHLSINGRALIALNFILAGRRDDGTPPPDPALADIEALQPVIDHSLETFTAY